MSDDFADHIRQQEPAIPTETGRSYTLTITLHPNGQLDLSGPLGNKVLAYGLLWAAALRLDELWALKTLEEHAANAQTSRGGIAGLLKQVNGG